jgi:hypothetical protein
MWHDVEWSEEYIENLKRNALIKLFEAHASMDAALKAEEEFWTHELVQKFPALQCKYDHRHFNYLLPGRAIFYGKIGFSDEDAVCLIGVPEQSNRYNGKPRAVTMPVWHQTSDGKKFKKLAVSYPCKSVIPFLSDVRPLTPKENDESKDMKTED